MIEQRTIFRQVTIFCNLFWIFSNFFTFHRNKFLYFMSKNSNNFFTYSFKGMTKISFQNTENHYSKMWRNMVPLAKYGSLQYNPPVKQSCCEKYTVCYTGTALHKINCTCLCLFLCSYCSLVQFFCHFSVNIASKILKLSHDFKLI